MKPWEDVIPPSERQVYAAAGYGSSLPLGRRPVLLVVDTNEIDFVNRPGDFEDLVGQIQKAKKGVQYYVPAASPK